MKAERARHIALSERVGRARAGEVDGASASEKLVIALSMGRRLPADCDGPGAAWLRLDDVERAVVRAENRLAANYSERESQFLLEEGISKNHGGAIQSEALIAANTAQEEARENLAFVEERIACRLPREITEAMLAEVRRASEAVTAAEEVYEALRSVNPNGVSL